MKRWQPWLFGALLATGTTSGCAIEPGAAPGDGVHPTPISGDAGTLCAHPAEGCACDPGQPPIDCYLDPLVDGNGRVTCSHGTRYCRSGVWTGCESIETYQLRSGPGIAALVTGPSECNPCDPACAVSRDTPSASDLPGHSTGLEYDPTAGGISIETSSSGAPPLTDTDRDGVPDIADDCVGAGAFRNADGTCYGGTTFVHVMPYGGPAQIDGLDIGVQVRTADVYFLMDTTGSMGGEIYRLQQDLTTGSFRSGCSGGIIGAIRCTIPDAWFGVGHHDDYPVSPYGQAGYDHIYENFQSITSSVSAAQTAVNRLDLDYGNDGPEGQTQALWAIATGGGLGPYLAARTGCPAGTWGYPCFRDGTIPIVVLFTDAPLHNGPYGYDYAFGGGGSTSLPSTTAVSGNDSVFSAYDTGDAATTWRGFTGYTCSYSDNYGGSCASEYSPDVVFRFTVSTTSTITLSLEGSSYDTLLSVRNSTFSELACNDDYVGYQSKIVRTFTPGTYYAIVEGWAYDCGSYRLSIGNPSAAATPPSSYPVTWAQTVAALNDRGIRVITVQSGDGYGIADANALADATGSYSSSGSRYVFPISSSGSGLSNAVVNAIVDLANYNRMDISARAVDNTATAGFDERSFVSSITALSWGPGSCSGISGGSTFVQCLPGTTVDFNVAFRNDVVMPMSTPQVFDFWVEVVGDGTFVLERVPVRIVVPANVPVYPPSGSYWRDYDSTAFCTATERPDWSTLSWTAPSIPTGTSIRWELRTAETLAEVSSATPVTFTTPPTSSPVDVAAKLASAGVPNYLSYLRVTAVLLSNVDRTATPVLNSFELRYDCIPNE